MRLTYCVAILFLAALIVPSRASSQLGLFSQEQRIAFTAEWKGERFADGRPKVPDTVLDGDLCTKVHRWMASKHLRACSDETVLRAAGRK